MFAQFGLDNPLIPEVTGMSTGGWGERGAERAGVSLNTKPIAWPHLRTQGLFTIWIIFGVSTINLWRGRTVLQCIVSQSVLLQKRFVNRSRDRIFRPVNIICWVSDISALKSAEGVRGTSRFKFSFGRAAPPYCTAFASPLANNYLQASV